VCLYTDSTAYWPVIKTTLIYEKITYVQERTQKEQNARHKT